MKEQSKVPEGLYYTKEHEWARVQPSSVVIGITDYASKTLNDVVYLSLPSLGQDLKQLASFGTVESTKAVSELYAPLSGKVSKVNDELANHPELVNQSPYEKGWIARIKVRDLSEKSKLMTSADYKKFVEGL